MQDVKKISIDFLTTMDISITKGSYNLSDDAVLDWFGQILCGRQQIKIFLISNLQKIKHNVKRVKVVTEVNHRMLMLSLNQVQPPVEINKVEPDDCQRGGASGPAVTPDQPIVIDYERMVEAPKRCNVRSRVRPITRRLRFVDVKAYVRQEIRSDFKDSKETRLLAVKKIVLGVDDRGDVAFVMYDNGPVESLAPQKLFSNLG